MPAKGSIIKTFTGKELVSNHTFKLFSKQTGKTDKDLFMRTARALFSQMARYIVEDEEGFKLPMNMGILMVHRYTPRKKMINPVKSKELKTRIVFQNLHSFGDQIGVIWIKYDTKRNKYIKLYFFNACRPLSRAASAACIAGKVYKKIESKELYAQQMLALDNIQEKYEEKLIKRK